MSTSRANRKNAAAPATPKLHTPVAPSVAAERQLGPIFLSSLVLAGTQFIVGLEIHPLASAHCLAWMLTMLASGGLIGTMRAIESEEVENIKTAPLTALLAMIQLAYFASACILFVILGALWVWLLFCVAFVALNTWIVGPMYWKNYKKRS